MYEEIGKGACGVVYKGFDPDTATDYAIKEFNAINPYPSAELSILPQISHVSVPACLAYVRT
jgi:hypothetical protein